MKDLLLSYVLVMGFLILCIACNTIVNHRHDEAPTTHRHAWLWARV